MLKVLFLILMLLSFGIHTPAQNQLSAYKFFEFEKISDNLLKEKSKEFYDKLKTENSSQGYVINYGTKREIAKRQEKLRQTIFYRENYDAARITFVQAIGREKLKTVFWIVPAGAEIPKP